MDLTFVNHDGGARRGRILREKERGGWTSKLMQINVSARYRLHPLGSPCRCRFPLSLLLPPFSFPAHDAQFSLIQGQSIAKPRSFGLFVIQPTTKYISYWFASSLVVQTFLFMHFSYLGQTSLSPPPPCLLFTGLIPDTKRISGASLPIPKLFTSAYVTGVLNVRLRRCGPLWEVCRSYVIVEQFLRYFNKLLSYSIFLEKVKCWNNNSENERKFVNGLVYRGQWSSSEKKF